MKFLACLAFGYAMANGNFLMVMFAVIVLFHDCKR
jgi:hypothetical protein